MDFRTKALRQVVVSGRRIAERDVTYLDAQLVGKDGYVLLHPAEFYTQFDHDDLLCWMQLNARYTLVTRELIEFLRPRCIDTLEIGAGMGDIGHHLGIRMTDSYVQVRQEMQAIYGLVSAACTRPPKEVEELDAVRAVWHYNPRTVIASWVTQLFMPGDTERRIGSFVFGVDMHEILNRVDTFVYIGNRDTHSSMRLLRRKHETLRPPWLVSRGFAPAKNEIWIWRPNKWKEKRPSGVRPTEPSHL